MRYYNLNDPKFTRSFSAAVAEGQPSGGGLFFPQEIPSSDLLSHSLTNNALSSIAVNLLSPMVSPDLKQEELMKICEETFNFPIPLVKLGPKLWILELFHGPTAAFKDVGARFLSRVINATSERHLTILVATSGDTGGAVAHGFYGVKGVDVVILYPKGRVSPLQERQLTELGGNISAIEVAGSFDDCQRMVKSALNDEALKELRPLSSANSINIARWLPQGVYYAWAIKQLQESPASRGLPPTMIIPSGNLGNLAAGLFAWRRGVPVSHFVAATNRNDRFAHYVNTGLFEPAHSVLTPSSAMDVGDPSNRSRVDMLFNGDHTKLRAQLSAHSVSDQETLSTIQSVYHKTGYLLCPHSAVAFAAHQYRIDQGLHVDDRDTILLATAHPAKFSEVIAPLIGAPPNLSDSLQTTHMNQGLRCGPQHALEPCSTRFRDYLRLSADQLNF